MLTDRELGTLKPRDKTFKVSDRDGMYAAVLPTGTISFRYDYRLNGRRETLAIGRYDADLVRKATREPEALEYGMDVSLREARTLLDRARRDVERGASPSRAKVEKRTAAAEALTFGGWAENYFKHKGDPKSGAEQLVPLHRGYDSLAGLQDRQAVVVNEQFDAASEACLPADQSIAFEVEHHLMDGRSRDGEEALHVAFGRSTGVYQAVGPDEGEILTLLVGEARAG